MPPKTITCSVCGEEVPKSQTYATGEKSDDGKPLRACKSHEGVMEKAEQMRADNIKRLRDQPKKREEEKKKRRRRSELDFSKIDRFAHWAWTHCWICERPGIFVADAYKLLLVAMEKAKIRGDNINPLDGAQLIKYIGTMPNVRCVFHRFALDNKGMKLYEEWKARFHKKTRAGIEMLRIVQLCTECQKRTKIKIPDRKPIPLKTLAMVAAAYEGSEMQDTIHRIAEVSVKLEDEDSKRKTSEN